MFRYAALTSNPIRAWMASDVVGLPLPRLMGLAYKPIIVVRHDPSAIALM